MFIPVYPDGKVCFLVADLDKDKGPLAVASTDLDSMVDICLQMNEMMETADIVPHEIPDAAFLGGLFNNLPGQGVDLMLMPEIDDPFPLTAAGVEELVEMGYEEWREFDDDKARSREVLRRVMSVIVGEELPDLNDPLALEILSSAINQGDAGQN